MNHTTQTDSNSHSAPRTGCAHTPGPWNVASGEIISDTRYVAKIYDWSNPGQCAPAYAEINAGLRAESDANARLIAAAPELLGALRKIVDYSGRTEHCKLSDLGSIASAAIAAAKEGA